MSAATGRSGAGRRTDSRVRIPDARLASRRIFSRQARMLGADEIRSWNERNRPLLDLYGLEIGAVTVLPIREAGRGGAGPLQTEHRDRLLLACSLGALAVSASGRGDLLAFDEADRKTHKLRIKENNDRNSTAAMNESLEALCAAAPDIALRVAIGEGARVKPGERGGNPTLYAGQLIGSGSAKRYSVAVDTVEGTTKSTLFGPSCGTLLFVTDSDVSVLPDVYFDKCQLMGIGDVTVADSLDRIVEAVMDHHGTREINIFSLDRPRHPIDRMLSLGANMRIDTDGDAYPAVAAGLSYGVFSDNRRPLDGVCANIGGAAETIASAAGAHYLGVRSTARFCAGRIERWEARYDFGPGEEDTIREKGFDPFKVYTVEDLVPGIGTGDGAFVAGAIADNWHVPGLDAVYVGGNFAEVSALFVGAAGTADLYRLTFSYRQPYEETVANLTPVLTRLLSRAPDAIPEAVREAVADTRRAHRLRHEVATSFYSHLTDPETPSGSGRLRMDLDAAIKAESPEGAALLRTLGEIVPDWFEVP